MTLDCAFPAVAEACIDTSSSLVIQTGEHIGGDCGIVDIGGGRDVWKEEVTESEGECIAHGVDEDVGGDEVEGVPGDDQAADALTQEGEVRPSGGEKEVASAEV